MSCLGGCWKKVLPPGLQHKLQQQPCRLDSVVGEERLAGASCEPGVASEAVAGEPGLHLL